MPHPNEIAALQAARAAGITSRDELANFMAQAQRFIGRKQMQPAAIRRADDLCTSSSCVGKTIDALPCWWGYVVGVSIPSKACDPK